MEENKNIKEADKSARNKEKQDAKDIFEQLKFEDEVHKEQMEDFAKGRISVRQFKALDVAKQEATLPKGAGVIGMTEQDREHNKNRLEQIKKDIVRNKHELDGNPEAEEQYSALAKKLKAGGLDHEEYVEVKKKMKKAEESGVGLMTKQKENPGMDIHSGQGAMKQDTQQIETRILNVQNNLQQLYKEEGELTGNKGGGFSGIGGRGVPNYKDEIIPTRRREKQERQYKKDVTARKGDEEFNVLFPEGAQTKRKAYNQYTGKWEWTSELSDTAKRKTEQALDEGQERALEERRAKNNFYEEADIQTPDPVGEHEGKSTKRAGYSTRQALFLGGIGKR